MALDLVPALDAPHLLAPPTAVALAALPPSLAATVSVAPIDAALADTAAFCDAYEVRLADSANCIVVAGKRGDRVTHAACVVPATTRADVNGVVRRLLDARRASFALMDDAVATTGMEYGGITRWASPPSGASSSTVGFAMWSRRSSARASVARRSRFRAPHCAHFRASR